MRFRLILLAMVAATPAAGAPKPGKTGVAGARRPNFKHVRWDVKSSTVHAVAPQNTVSRRPRGQVSLIKYTQSWEGKVLTPKGHILPAAREAISKLLGATGSRPAVPDRLIHLLVGASDAFGGRPLRVVCGYRTTSYSPDSRHRHSAAIDFSVIGVRNSELRDYLLTLDQVGVGYYPNSSFVHLDVRDEKTYWIDYAGPGEPPRYTARKAATASAHPVRETTQPQHPQLPDSAQAELAVPPEAAADADQDAVAGPTVAAAEREESPPNHAASGADPTPVDSAD